MNNNPIPVLVIDPLELTKVLSGKIKEAELELKKHPSYDAARNLSKLRAEYKAHINQLRSRINVAYDFNEDMLNVIQMRLG